MGGIYPDLYNDVLSEKCNCHCLVELIDNEHPAVWHSENRLHRCWEYVLEHIDQTMYMQKLFSIALKPRTSLLAAEFSKQFASKYSFLEGLDGMLQDSHSAYEELIGSKQQIARLNKQVREGEQRLQKELQGRVARHS